MADGRPGWARTRELVRAFRLEQTDPAAFYGLLAADSVRQAGRWAPLAGARVLDVGGGPGYFAGAFAAAGARYVGCDPVLAGLGGGPDGLAGLAGPDGPDRLGGGLAGPAGPAGPDGPDGAGRPPLIAGDGQHLPFRTAAFDLCFSSNVLEHVPRPATMLREMVRVTAPGGAVFVAFTNWLGPLGGHETAPWHYLGGEYAARRYQRRHGYPPKNRHGVGLFPLSIRAALRTVGELRASGDVRTLSVFPRYHPWWLHWVARVPGLREFATANCVLVLRRR